MTMMVNNAPPLLWEVRMRRTVALLLWIVTMVVALPRPAAAVPAFAGKYGSAAPSVMKPGGS